MAKLKIRKEILWTLLVVVLIAAIIIPIIIVYTAAEQDNGNRIACFPLMEKDNDEKLESTCNEKGCIYDAVAENVKCYLPLSGSKSYGYEVIYFKQERKSRLFYSFFSIFIWSITIQLLLPEMGHTSNISYEDVKIPLLYTGLISTTCSLKSSITETKCSVSQWVYSISNANGNFFYCITVRFS